MSKCISPCRSSAWEKQMNYENREIHEMIHSRIALDANTFRDFRVFRSGLNCSVIGS
jgi:hypothetical protein